VRKHARRLALVLTTAVVLALAPVATAFAGQGNGVPNSHGANSFGNAVSSGATPQPSGK